MAEKFLEQVLLVPEELATKHKEKITSIYGGYSFKNLDEDNPGCRVELRIRVENRYVSVLHSEAKQCGTRHVQCAESQIGQEAYNWLLANGAEVLEELPS